MLHFLPSKEKLHPWNPQQLYRQEQFGWLLSVHQDQSLLFWLILRLEASHLLLQHTNLPILRNSVEWTYTGQQLCLLLVHLNKNYEVVMEVHWITNIDLSWARMEINSKLSTQLLPGRTVAILSPSSTTRAIACRPNPRSSRPGCSNHLLAGNQD